MLLAQKNRLRLNAEEYRLVKAFSWHCARLYNVGLYNVRQHFFATKEYMNYVNNAPMCYENENYRMLHTDIGQQILRKVDHNFKSFFGLLRAKKAAAVARSAYGCRQQRNRLMRLSRKREWRINDYFNRVAKYITDHCASKGIGTLVVGNFLDSKQEINLGKKTNQNFVSVPYGKLLQKLKSKCEQVGISYQETEESYTSKCSFLDGEAVQKHDTPNLLFSSPKAPTTASA